jgi:hypothetical protein
LIPSSLLVVVVIYSFICVVYFIHSFFASQFTVPNDETVAYDGLAGGTVFGYGEGVPMGDTWEVEDGIFALSTDGEKLFLYCEEASSEPRLLMTLSYTGSPYQDAGLVSYAFGESSLPEELRESGAIVLPHFNNYVYEGPTRADNEILRTAVVNPDSWTGKNNGRFRIDNVTDGAVGVLRQGVVMTLLVGLVTTVFPGVVVSMFFC